MSIPAGTVKNSLTDAVQLDSLRAGPAAASKSTSTSYEPSAAMERFLCEICGDVIGVYEPLVMRTIESERATSRAAEPELRARDGAYFHRTCHDAAAG
jgi:hypothetical protein